jgi:hypothetical protein
MIGGTIAAEIWLPVLIEAGILQWLTSIQTLSKACRANWRSKPNEARPK